MECVRKATAITWTITISILNSESDAEAMAELVATTLSRRTMPFIRYRVQDITRFIDAPALAALRCGALSAFAAGAMKWW